MLYTFSKLKINIINTCYLRKLRETLKGHTCIYIYGKDIFIWYIQNGHEYIYRNKKWTNIGQKDYDVQVITEVFLEIYNNLWSEHNQTGTLSCSFLQ